MPARFVEVVDVGVEASSTVAALLASGRGVVGQISFNLTEALGLGENATPSDVLWSALEAYNVTFDTLPTDWAEALRAAGLDITTHDAYVPVGRARVYLGAALVLVLTREAFVRWRVRRMLKAYGMHAH